MLDSKSTRPYSLRLAQPSYWNKPDPTADARWSTAASKPSAKAACDNPFWLLDGPPYANGDLHLGHVLNKCLKDAFARHQMAMGRPALWRSGWDCHGLPLELATQKRPGTPRRHEPGFLSACREEAKYWQSRQSGTLSLLGLACDLESPWTTMDPSREARAMGMLMNLWESGVLVERHSPTHWCPSCQSALAASELEKAEGTKESLYAWTPLHEVSTSAILSTLGLHTEPLGLVYWTTTPWTLWANQAFAFAPEATLALFRLEDGKLCMVQESQLAEMANAYAQQPWAPLARFSASLLASTQCLAKSPMGERFVPLAGADFVKGDEGSGFVHVAPAFGPEDFEWAESNPHLHVSLDNPMGKDGRYKTPQGSEGCQDRKEAGEAALRQLNQDGLVLAYSHARGEAQTCWRHGVAVFYMAARQWALDLDHPFAGCPEGMRARALGNLDRVRFLPTPKARNALERLLAGRRFWTLSRDRHWGLPLPLLRDSCGAVSASTSAWWRQAMETVALQGVEGYARLDPPEGLHKETQCVDVWFDSGCAFETAREAGLATPDMVVEGADQTRGWFLSSMLLAAFHGQDPAFKTVACHGFVVDDKGRKLSKSLGNAPDTQALLQEHGADTLRLWSLSQTMGEDVVWSKKSLAQAASETREWRNFLRFLLAHRGDDPEGASPSPKDPLEHLVMERLHMAHGLWNDGFEKGQPHLALASLSDFRRWASSNWFELSKHALYCQANGDNLYRRRSLMSWTLCQCAAMLRPFLPLAVAEAQSLLAWSLPESCSFSSPGMTRWRPELATQARLSLEWRDGLFKALDAKRSMDQDTKGRYEVVDPRSKQAAYDLGTETSHLARGLCFGVSHPEQAPTWKKVTGWECPRCRGFFTSQEHAEPGDAKHRRWLWDRFGASACSGCYLNETHWET